MPKVTILSENDSTTLVDKKFLEGKRHLTPREIYILIENRNISSDKDWQNIYVSAEEGEFNPEQIVQSKFSGTVVLGSIRPATLKFHDLELKTGIYCSSLQDVVTGDDCVINNVNYLCNYHIADRVMLFNIQEMSCTLHSKFGEGILKEGEPEKNRIWIGVANENDNRAVLAFNEMITADAWMWSKFRDDKALMERFVELTEYGRSKKNDTYGIIEDDAVIKNCTLLKDVKVGKNAYIKGAFKLKNITVLSSEDEPSQIGEGVEMVNGIMGYGSRVFYQAIAIRFVIGRNCQLKYGARLLNSVLGDNCVVSCCELLNNLVFPFHEQHHNSSFLIASTIMGQSNIASAATIGSNHNSRSPDGEMVAGRGFWPGLCSDFKYDSCFASFVLVAKGSYQNELNITYPFSLVAPGKAGEIQIIPAWWFLYNMFAIVRNKFKFKARDKRVVKVQHIETNPIAPDSVQEIMTSLERIIELTARYLKLPEDKCLEMTESGQMNPILASFREKIISVSDDNEVHQIAKDFLHQNRESDFILVDDRCQKKYGAQIHKTAQAYREYRCILKYFAAESLMEWAEQNNKESLSSEDLFEIEKLPLYTKWVNAGGQIISTDNILDLFSRIKTGLIVSWPQVHDYYNECQKSYVNAKARYALHIIEYLYSARLKDFTSSLYDDFVKDVAYVSVKMLECSISSREKDYTDFFRSITFRNNAEKEAVLGTLGDNSFLNELKDTTEIFQTSLEKLFSKLR